ncbi:hypothetical protein RDV89_07595 [Nocardioides zeae]|uniref:Uncharacterized protein n=1 Tax=Nocardioides imazamoxiresistens TaxID=3231893 RepID=A0ABU3PUM1_9ACTN|nr:hypothetical protein [Nocardioides zeae]MDT9592927.1 hypothetical protein [Nocardioides zeae]
MSPRRLLLVLFPVVLLGALLVAARAGLLGATAEDAAGGTPWTDVETMPGVVDVEVERWSEEDPAVGPFYFRYAIAMADDASAGQIVDVVDRAFAEGEWVGAKEITVWRESAGAARPLLRYSGDVSEPVPGLRERIGDAERATSALDAVLGEGGHVAVDRFGQLAVALDSARDPAAVTAFLDEVAQHPDLSAVERWEVAYSAEAVPVLRTDEGVTTELRAVWSELAALQAADDLVVDVSLHVGPAPGLRPADPARRGEIATGAVLVVPGVDSAEDLDLDRHGDVVLPSVEPFLDLVAQLPPGTRFDATTDRTFLSAVVGGRGETWEGLDQRWNAAAEAYLAER